MTITIQVPYNYDGKLGAWEGRVGGSDDPTAKIWSFVLCLNKCILHLPPYTRGDQKSFAIQYDVQMAQTKQFHYFSM